MLFLIGRSPTPYLYVYLVQISSTDHNCYNPTQFCTIYHIRCFDYLFLFFLVRSKLKFCHHNKDFCDVFLFAFNNEIRVQHQSESWNDRRHRRTRQIIMPAPKHCAVLRTALLPNAKFSKHSIKDILHINQTRHFPDCLCCVSQLFSAENNIFSGSI